MTRRRVAVFTGTRAEYGLMLPLMRAIQASELLSLQLIVSGMHLSPEFGNTWQRIAADGFDIDAKVEMLLSSDTPVGVVKSIGVGLLGLADALERLRPDLLVVLGDRFEALAVAQAALILRVPIAHLHGGEITEGAYDDSIRHAITKMAHLHFTSTETYRQRVIRMGEGPDTVFNVGAIGIDSLKREAPIDLEALNSEFGFELRPPYFLVTYHPATAADEDPVGSFSALTDALDCYSDHQVLITHPNADNGGRAITARIEDYARRQRGRVHSVISLGQRGYAGAMAHAAAVIGNSSSGIIESPSFGVPTVNIGARQAGRVSAESVLHCAADTQSIAQAIRTALSAEFVEHCRSVVNPYGAGDTTARIVKGLENWTFAATPKKFYDEPILP